MKQDYAYIFLGFVMILLIFLLFIGSIFTINNVTKQSCYESNKTYIKINSANMADEDIEFCGDISTIYNLMDRKYDYYLESEDNCYDSCNISIYYANRNLIDDVKFK